jgi:deoxyribodipyrimidine photo-lyase
MEKMVNHKRIREIKNLQYSGGAVVYWMSRDQRFQDNWALVYAQEKALEYRAPLAVLFCMVPEFLGATVRQYGFMLRGLQELHENLAGHDIPLILLRGAPAEEIPAFIAQRRVGFLVTDFDPLRIKKRWKDGVSRKVEIPFQEADAHNVVPIWEASPKQEYAAHTFRPKIKSKLVSYLENFPELKPHPYGWTEAEPIINWESIRNALQIDKRVGEVNWIVPGERAAQGVLKNFIDKKLRLYTTNRNNPTEHAQSGLSPYLHFGHIAAGRVALQIKESGVDEEFQNAFLEELIVRRELSDNFCFYNPHYDSLDGLHDWARKTLDEHRRDKRKYLYSLRELDNGMTHDDLWNAAQLEMVKSGKMHGYMRMYWAKKILEWTRTPEEAFEYAIYLNDRYELDGRDPNGYVGIAWSIGGLHDRPWPEREIFGKIRYMSYNGCKHKFNIKQYIEEISDSTL